MEQEGDLFRLKLAEIFPEDSGMYACEAGDAITACTLIVKVPEEKNPAECVTAFPKSLTVDEGSPVEFSVAFSSAPASVAWRKDKSVIEENDRFKLHLAEGDARLSIPAALATDSGIYSAALTFGEALTELAFALQVVAGEDVPDGVDVNSLIAQVNNENNENNES